jgi:predicted dehydrogenase
MNLLLVGAGQIGSRHLQSCLKFHEKLEIYVVDSSEESLAISKSRASEIDSLINHEVYYVTELDSINELKFDFLIIATGAGPRLSILNNVLERFTIKSAILEKILFQTLDAYISASRIISEKKVNAFVNCPLRVYPFFKEIKEKYITKGSSVVLNYRGGEWVGLGCNSIHYLDLLNFLTDENVIEIDVGFLDKEIKNSKREGNVEFTGIVEGTYSSGSKITIESIAGSDMNSTIEILSNGFGILIDELTGGFRIYKGEILIEEASYDVLYQSDLTHLMLEQIEKTESCELIDFHDSVKLHQEFISKLLEHYNKISGNGAKTLPIT